MAIEKITLRLSDQDPIEAEIITIMRGKAERRKSPWLREVLVAGYRAMRETGITLPAVSLDVSAVFVAEEDKDQQQVITPTSKSKESLTGSQSHSSTPAVLPPAVTEHKKNQTSGASALAGLTGYADDR